MNLKNLTTMLAAQSLLAGAAVAQTCTPSAGALNDTSGTVTIDTCSSADQLTSICNSSTPIGNAPDTIYSIDGLVAINAGINVRPAGYDAYVAVLQGTCSGGATCVRESDSNGAGGAETVSLAGLSPGNYFLLITSFAAAGNCGSTEVQPVPTPVALRSFSID